MWQAQGIAPLWLNGEFLERAFDDRERARLCPVRVKAERNPRFDVDPGRDTMDAIWIPSLSEARELIAMGLDTLCEATSHAQNEGLYVDDTGCCNWWLRTPGRASDHAIPVNPAGSIGEWGCLVSSKIGVRPVIALSID